MWAEHSNVPPSVPRIAGARLMGHEGPVNCIDFTSDGKYCVTGGQDRTVRLWNPFRLDPAYTSPDDRPHLNSNSRGPSAPPRALPMQTYANGLSHNISAICCLTSGGSNPAEQVLAATDKALVLTDLVSARFVTKWSSHHSGRINCVAATEDGHALLSGSYDGTVAIWDGRALSNHKPIQVLSQAKDSVTDLHIEQDIANRHDPVGLIRSASVDGCVRTYDLRKGVLSVDQVGAPITGMQLTNDRQCLAASCTDGTIRLIETSAGDAKPELLNTFQGAHEAGTYGLNVDVLADDTTIVSGSEDGSIVLYDLVRATPVQKLYPIQEQRQQQHQRQQVDGRAWPQGLPPMQQPTELSQPRHNSNPSTDTKKSPTICVRAHPVHDSVMISASHHRKHAAPVVWAHSTDMWYG